jgi:hypothetical protein
VHNRLTKRLLAVSIGSLAIGALLLWMSVNMYDEYIAELRENERCYRDLGFCRPFFPFELERDAIVTAIFGVGFAAIGAIAYGRNTRLFETWKPLTAVSFVLAVGYGLYFFALSELYQYGTFYLRI